MKQYALMTCCFIVDLEIYIRVCEHFSITKRSVPTKFRKPIMLDLAEEAATLFLLANIQVRTCP